MLPSFLREVAVYLDMLEARGHEFYDNPEEEYLITLGAFCYMYRMQVKVLLNILGHYKIGGIYQEFFHQPKVKQDIDLLFTERIKRFLNRMQG